MCGLNGLHRLFRRQDFPIKESGRESINAFPRAWPFEREFGADFVYLIWPLLRV
jgi:hypothetical protein